MTEYRIVEGKYVYSFYVQKRRHVWFFWTPWKTLGYYSSYSVEEAEQYARGDAAKFVVKELGVL